VKEEEIFMSKIDSKDKKDTIHALIGVAAVIVAITIIFLVVMAVVKPSVDAASKKCEIQQNEVMKNIGGDLDIVSMDSYVGSSESAKIKGSFIFFSGIYNGKTETMIRFSWQSRDGFSYLYEVPSSLFQRILSTDGQMKVNFNLSFGDPNDDFRYKLPSEVTPLDYNEIIKNVSGGLLSQ
jgi:hypothetical protein